MDRKGIIAVVLSVIVLVAWQFLYVNKQRAEWDKRQAAAKSAAAAATPTPGEQPEASPPAVVETAPSPTPAAAEETPAVEEPATPVEETVRTVSTAVADYEFTSVGGGLRKIVLKKHRGEEDKPVVLNRFPAAPVGAITTQPGGLPDRNSELTVDGSIVTCRETGPLQITKTFRLPEPGEDSYQIRVDIEIRNTAAKESDDLYLNLGGAAPIHPRDLATYTAFDWDQEGKVKEKGVTWFNPSKVPLLGVQMRPAQTLFQEPVEKLSWAGVKNQYFSTLVTSLDGKFSSVWAVRSDETLDDQHVYAIHGGIGLPKIPAGDSAKISGMLYAGPNEYSRLKTLGENASGIMQLGMFKPVSIFLLKMMNWLKSVLGNYAAAIFVMTLIIKSAMWPLQNTATQSMKKMQALQPKMAELREKYKDDPTRMNQELMKLYKDYGINPFSGCLPMFVQIPIFFGFYRMLAVTPELRNSHFLWIHDLSQPDTVAHIGPFPLNVLPLIMAVTMVWQMRITPKSGDPVQQRIFMFVPLIFVVFCYNFASALALYWTVQNLFSIVQLYVTRNQEIPALRKVGGSEPGRGGRKKQT